jgi:rubrerythrin
MALRTISEVFDFAIAAEIEAARTYRDFASRVKRHDVRRLLLSIADEEYAHQKSLEQVREGDLSLFAMTLPEIELSAPLAAVGLDPEMTSAQLLLAAIDAERQAYQLYTEFAAATDDLGLSTLLRSLAVEETRHWQKFEQAYDAVVADSPSD